MSIKHLQFDDSAFIAFGFITGTYANLLVMGGDSDLLLVFNTTDAAIFLSIPSGAGVSKNIRFPAKTSVAIDCRTNSKRLAAGTIQVKYDTAPTLGEVTVTACR